MSNYFLIGICLLILGSIYGWWSFFAKKKNEDSNTFSKINDNYDKIIPIIIIVSGIIMILKNV